VSISPSEFALHTSDSNIGFRANFAQRSTSFPSSECEAGTFRRDLSERRSRGRQRSGSGYAAHHRGAVQGRQPSEARGDHCTRLSLAKTASVDMSLRCNAWTSQQIVEAFANRDATRYLIRDRDSIYGEDVSVRISSMGVGTVKKSIDTNGRCGCEETSSRSESVAGGVSGGFGRPCARRSACRASSILPEAWARAIADWSPLCAR
jgi:hypothetical protein